MNFLSRLQSKQINFGRYQRNRNFPSKKKEKTLLSPKGYGMNYTLLTFRPSLTIFSHNNGLEKCVHHPQLYIREASMKMRGLVSNHQDHLEGISESITKITYLFKDRPPQHVFAKAFSMYSKRVFQLMLPTPHVKLKICATIVYYCNKLILMKSFTPFSNCLSQANLIPLLIVLRGLTILFLPKHILGDYATHVILLNHKPPKSLPY